MFAPNPKMYPPFIYLALFILPGLCDRISHPTQRGDALREIEIAVTVNATRVLGGKTQLQLDYLSSGQEGQRKHHPAA